MRDPLTIDSVMSEFVHVVLPPGLGAPYWRALKKQGHRRLRLVFESLAMVMRVYWRQILIAFNWLAFVVQMAAVIFCFGAMALPKTMVVILIAVMGGLAFRDAYTFGRARDFASCSARMGADSLVSLVFLLLAQTLMMSVDHASAIQNSDLFRGATVCLPLLSTLRMAFAIRPAANAIAFPTEGLTPKGLYYRIKLMNFAYMFVFLWIMALSVTDIPHYWPDFWKAFGPVMFFKLWLRIQKNWLAKAYDWVTLFTHPGKSDLRYYSTRLAPGLEWGEPFFVFSFLLECGIQVLIVFAMTDAVFPWLTGHTASENFFKATAAMLAFSTSMLSWKYLKQSNREAVKALEKGQKEMEEKERARLVA